jgi:hypothetical protein
MVTAHGLKERKPPPSDGVADVGSSGTNVERSSKTLAISTPFEAYGHKLLYDYRLE